MQPNPAAHPSDLPTASAVTPVQGVSPAAPPPQIEGCEILEELAAAGQGRVWQARQRSRRRVVALKVPRVDTGTDVYSLGIVFHKLVTGSFPYHVNATDPCGLLGEPTHSDNCCQVVTGSETDTTAVLDGFTITGGMATGALSDARGERSERPPDP